MIFFVATIIALVVAVLVAIAAPIIRGRGSGSPSLQLAAMAVLGVAPIVAVVIYMQVGAPHALDPDVRAAASAAPDNIEDMAPEERAAMIENMVQGLAARLEADPQDLQGWRMLARSYGVLGRNQEAVDAWREALVLSEGAVDDWRGLALALVELKDPAHGPAVKEAFEEVLLQAPDDPLALYFVGYAAQADGDSARAAELFRRLRGQTPDDAPLAMEIDQMLERIGEPNEKTAPEADDQP